MAMDDLDQEAILDPGQKIIDAHHHLWSKGGWNYLYPELLADIGTGHDIRATVYVEGGSLTKVRGAGGTMYRADGPLAEAPLGETEFANGVAAMAASGQYGSTRVAASIVAFADLRRGDAIRPVLEQHRRFTRVKGVRYIAGWIEDAASRNPAMELRPGLLLDPEFRNGMKALEELGLSFETTILHYQIKELVDAARAMPGLRIAICHVGGPYGIGHYAGRPKEAFDDWLRELRELAACPNVSLKLGGLAQMHTGLIPPPGTATADIAALWGDHVDAAIEAFGPSRCMFESNTPVDTKHVPYKRLWNVFKTLAARYSAEERDELFHGTASRFYDVEMGESRGDA